MLQFGNDALFLRWNLSRTWLPAGLVNICRPMDLMDKTAMLAIHEGAT